MKKIMFLFVVLSTLMLFATSCYKPNEPITETPTDTIPFDDEPVSILFSVNGVYIKMLEVEGGTFNMGAYSDDKFAADAEKPKHTVTLSTFFIGETEVPQVLWQAVMGNNPSEFKGDRIPVENVSWNDCQDFIAELNQLLSAQLDGKHFRLPTEAEWEFAARGGNKSKGYTYSGDNNIERVGWYEGNSYSQPHRTNNLSPNELGIYDMTGNVFEWCLDWFGEDYYSVSPSNNPQGPTEGTARVNRGGSWKSHSLISRCISRNSALEDCRYNNLGLRLVLSE